MTIARLANILAKMEGKKHQAIVGDVREIIKLLCQVEAQARLDRGTVLTINSEIFEALEFNVEKMMKKKRKKIK